MPLKTWNNKTDFDNAYRRNDNGVIRHFEWKGRFPLYEFRATKLISAASYTNTSNISVLGAGFGWLCHALNKQGIPLANLAAYDSSTWIQLDKDGVGKHSTIDGVVVPINSDDVTKPAGRAQIKGRMSGNFDMVTESVLESLTDQECIDLSADIKKINTVDRVIHIVFTQKPNGVHDPTYNWKTVDDWKLLLPNDFFLDIHDYDRGLV